MLSPPLFRHGRVPANFAWIEKSQIPASPFKGSEPKDLGWILHDIDFTNGMEPRFFRAVMRDGVVAVPAFRSAEVRG